MPEDDDLPLPEPTRPRPSLDGGDSILDTLAGKLGGISRVHLPDDGSAHISTGSGPSAASEALPEGRGNYKVLTEIARGGMGIVLRCHDTDLGRDVAMKVLTKKLADRPDVVQRFVEEAQIGGQLQHPGIVPVYELGLMADDRPYFTMKLVKGRTLAALFADRKTPEDERARMLTIFESICQTVAYAHSKGVIHRDLKPANVMVGAFGEVQVVDWGLAKVLGSGGVADELRAQQSQRTVIETVRSGPGSSGSDSLAGSVLGTPDYMAPEQANGELERVDQSSDVFALGAILCELITGKPPYVETEDERVLVQAAQARLDPARERIDAASADSELKKLCLECLTRAQAARPRNGEEVAKRVHKHLAGLERRAHDAQLAAERERVEAKEQRRRSRLTLALAATVILSLLALGVGLRWMEKQAATRHTAALAELRGAVDVARTRVVDFQESGRLGEALAIADAALARVTDAGVEFPDAREDAQRLVREVQSRIDARDHSNDLARRNTALLERCDDLRMRQIESDFGFSAKDLDDELDAAYAQAFKEYGADIDSGENLSATLELLRTSGIAVEASLALDDWAAVRAKLHGRGSMEVESIASFAFDLDLDPARTRIREAFLAGDADGVLEIARTEDLASLPPSTIWVLSQGLLQIAEGITGSMRRVQFDSEAGKQLLRVVEKGVALYPQDFLLNFRFGDLLQNRGLPAIAAPYLVAACSLRPGNAAVHAVLGDGYNALGDHRQGMHAYQRALEIRPAFGDLLASYIGSQAIWCGEYETAIAAFQHEADRTPADPSNLAMVEIARWFAAEPLQPGLLESIEAGGQGDLLTYVAWGLALHPDPDQRDPQRCLEIIEQRSSLSELSPLVGAAAHLQLGHAPTVLEILDAAPRFINNRAARAGRSLARAGAQHMLGNRAAARLLSDQAEKLLLQVQYAGQEGWSRSVIGALHDIVREIMSD